MSWSYIATLLHQTGVGGLSDRWFPHTIYYYLYAGAIILTLSLLTMGDIIREHCKEPVLHAGISFFIAIIAMILESGIPFKAEFRLASTMSVIGGAAMFFAVRFTS